MKNAYYYFALIELSRSRALNVTERRNVAASLMKDYCRLEKSPDFKLTRAEANAKAVFRGSSEHLGYKATTAQKDVLRVLGLAFSSLIESGESQEEIGNATLLIVRSDFDEIKQNKHNSEVFPVVQLSIERLKQLRSKDLAKSLVNSRNRARRSSTPVLYGSLKDDFRIVDFKANPPDPDEIEARKARFIQWWNLTPTELRVKKRSAAKLFIADSTINENFQAFLYAYETYLETNNGTINKPMRRDNFSYLSSTILCHKGFVSMSEILSKRWVPKENY